MDEKNHRYIAIDMKSFYASVECVARGLDPLKANLLVADPERSDGTICLAVSPALKAIGVPARPRLLEAKRAIEMYERQSGTRVRYIIAVPHMALYEKVSAQIYGICLKYAAAEDIHVYSIDESFIDCTPYLHFYEAAAGETGQAPEHIMALTIIRDVLRSTGITATVGIGTNLYLAKVAMDIVAKKAPADKDGVRIATLTEDSYRRLLWDHRPLTDFWQIGRGKSARLARNNMFTMGDIAERSLWDEEWFYKVFGVDAEILIDHAWGIEPVTMYDIKHYHSSSRSLSNGQVLPRPYEYAEASVVLREMIDLLCCDMFGKNLVAPKFAWWAGYDHKTPGYGSEAYANGSVRFSAATNLSGVVIEKVMRDAEKKIDHAALLRRLGICACDVADDDGAYQMDMFTDFDMLARERQLHAVFLKVRARYGANALLRGINLLEGATAIERNQQIGGHKA